MITFLIFVFFAALSVASAVSVVVQKNAMHSVLYLAFTVLSISGVFFTLQAEYLGAIQLLVYGGGIVVLYIFVIIIVNLKDIVPEKRKLLPKLIIIGFPVLLAGLIAWVVLGNRYTVVARAGGDLSLPSLADMLLTTYTVPFELASILLLAVLIGAIIVARKKYLHDRD